MVVCLELGADLHMAQLMPLPLTVSCSSKIQIGFTFLVPAHLGSPEQRAVKRVCVCATAMISEKNYLMSHQGLNNFPEITATAITGKSVLALHIAKRCLK